LLVLGFLCTVLAAIFVEDKLWAAVARTQNVAVAGQQVGQVAAAGGRAALAQQRAGGKKILSPELTAAIKQEQEAPIGSTEEEDSEDMYTQSEALLQVDEVKEKMAHFLLYAQGTKLEEGEVKIEKTPNEIVSPYLNIVSAVLD